MVLNKHKMYFEKVMKRYEIEDINIEVINNIFFREYKTNYLSVIVQSDHLHNHPIHTDESSFTSHSSNHSSVDNTNSLSLSPTKHSPQKFTKHTSPYILNHHTQESLMRKTEVAEDSARVELNNSVIVEEGK